MAEITIRPMRPQDWPQASRAFAEGIARHRTFHTELPSWEVWNQAHLPGCRLVAERDGAVVGFVALSPVSARACYRGVAEVSLYVLREA
ncbi:MAG: N-acetyltransferase, partial [Oscillospiraceae bacterium]